MAQPGGCDDDAQTGDGAPIVTSRLWPAVVGFVARRGRECKDTPAAMAGPGLDWGWTEPGRATLVIAGRALT